MLGQKEITIDGLAIQYRQAGSGGKAVVCLPGLGASARYFVPLMEELGKTRTVVCPDQPDSGKSENTSRKLTVSALAEFYGKFIAGLKLTDYVLVANSMGCQVAAELVIQNPEAGRALVLIGPTVNPHERGAFRQIGRWLQDGLHEPVRGAKILARDIRDTGLPRLIRTLRQALKDRIEEKLPQVSQPTLLIRGEHDPLCPQYWAKEAAALLPAGKLEVIKGASHAVHYSKPAAVASLINVFLADRAVT